MTQCGSDCEVSLPWSDDTGEAWVPPPTPKTLQQIYGIDGPHLTESEIAAVTALLQSRAKPPLPEFIDDPGILEGLTPEEVAALVPEGWVESPARKGGTRYSDPTRDGVQIIVEGPLPGSLDPIHLGEYVKVSTGRGEPTRIPLAGNPALPRTDPRNRPF